MELRGGYSLTHSSRSRSLNDRWCIKDDRVTTFLHSSMSSAFRWASTNHNPVHSAMMTSLYSKPALIASNLSIIPFTCLLTFTPRQYIDDHGTVVGICPNVGSSKWKMVDNYFHSCSYLVFTSSRSKSVERAVETAGSEKRHLPFKDAYPFSSTPTSC